MVRFLELQGFTVVRVRGSHHVMARDTQRTSILVHLTSRTLFWNSKAILPELLKREEAKLATDAFMSHHHVFLWVLPLNHYCLPIGRPISTPLG